MINLSFSLDRTTTMKRVMIKASVKISCSMRFLSKCFFSLNLQWLSPEELDDLGSNKLRIPIQVKFFCFSVENQGIQARV